MRSAAAAGSGITIHMLQEKDGKARRLTLPPAIATPSALRHHLLAQGLVSPLQADGLKLRRRKEVCTVIRARHATHWSLPACGLTTGRSTP